MTFKKIIKPSKLLFIVSISFFSLFSSLAKTNEKELDIGIIIENVITLVNQHYVFPKTAKEVETFLTLQLKNKRYDTYDSAELIAIKLTSDLQRLTQDKHLRLRTLPKENISEETKSPKVDNLGFKSTEIIKGNIGYLVLDSFSSKQAAHPMVDNTFQLFKDVDAMIIDLRNNTGGSPELIQYISNYLFASKTQLSSLYWREGSRTVEYWTSGTGKLLNVTRIPLFILTSPSTFSAAEAFSYDLQSHKRALVIGAQTKGGANPGRTFNITDKLNIFIPTGTAINPITNTNWEGSGVTPDHEINHLFAFELATELATEAAIKHRVKYGRATKEEKYRKTNSAPIYGSWHLAKKNCPLKISTAQPRLNEVTGKYQTPYKIKYYGNGSLRIKFKLGTKYKKYEQSLYFKDRRDEKSGISNGFRSPEALKITHCKY